MPEAKGNFSLNLTHSNFVDKKFIHNTQSFKKVLTAIGAAARVLQHAEAATLWCPFENLGIILTYYKL